MTLDQLITLARIRLRDRVKPYLVDDEMLMDFANTAVNEACIRARLLQTRVSIAVVAGTTNYTIPYTVIGFKRLSGQFTETASGQITPIDWVSNREFDDASRGILTSAGTPSMFTWGMGANTIDIFRTPANAGTLSIDIYRQPTEDEQMASGGDEPVIPLEFHRDLVYWMTHEAFLIPDSDVFNPKSSDRDEAKFATRFGTRVSAKAEQFARQSVVGATAYPKAFGVSPE